RKRAGSHPVGPAPLADQGAAVVPGRGGRCHDTHFRRLARDLSVPYPSARTNRAWSKACRVARGWGSDGVRVRTMKALLYESELLEASRQLVSSATRFHVAMALVTRSGVDALLSSMEDCLAEGGEGRFLVGIDMPTEPYAIECLHGLSERY